MMKRLLSLLLVAALLIPSLALADTPKPIVTIPYDQLRQKFGVVFQNDFITEGTISHNIRFFRDLTDEQVQKAADCAQAAFIQEKEGGMDAEVVHSLAKWKRMALHQYGFRVGRGLYTDMNAIRRDEELDNIHSIYVDQWDWERIIAKEDRTEAYLKETVQSIVDVICDASEELKKTFPQISVELCRQVEAFNRGVLLDGEEHEPLHRFSFGVAGYPEKHEEAMNIDMDIEFLKAKIDAGAQYVVTQMFFDNSKYFSFVERCRAAGINVPIIPGIKPLTSLTQKALLPKTFHIDLPMDLAKELRRCESNDDVKALGVEWGIAQARELKAANVASIHFYSMNATASIEQIAKKVY